MTPNRLARWALALCVAALAAASFAPAASAAKKKQKDPDPTLKVMTRNIYLGGNIFLPIGAPDRAAFESKTQELWDQIRFTNFPARATLLANEVKKTKPDLIGLQEVAIWRRSPDGVKDGSATPSQQVVYDFLKTLNSELKKKGLKYRTAISQQEADIEAPTQQYDVRLTMRDVILVRTGKNAPKLTKKKSAQFKSDIGVRVDGAAIAHHWETQQLDRVTETYGDVVRWTWRLSLAPLALVFAAPAAVLAVFGPGFNEGVVVVLILASGALIESLAAPSAVVLNQTGHNRLNMGINVSALLGNIALNLALIPAFGIAGAAAAWMLTLLVPGLVRIAVVRRLVTQQWPVRRPHLVSAGAALVSVLLIQVLILATDLRRPAHPGPRRADRGAGLSGRSCIKAGLEPRRAEGRALRCGARAAGAAACGCPSSVAGSTGGGYGGCGPAPSRSRSTS